MIIEIAPIVGNFSVAREPGRPTREFIGDGIETQQLLDRTMGENGGLQ